MNRLLTVLLAGLFVFAAAAPASATDARVASLAGAGAYLEDDYNIFTWYATLPSYSNMVWIGMQDENYYMGASYGLGEEGKYGTLAMFYYENAPGLNPFETDDDDLIENWDGYDIFTNSRPSKFTVMYGYAMEKLSLGLFFARADEYDKSEVGDAAEEDSYSYMTIGAGVRFDLGENAYIDIAGDFNLATYKDEDVVNDATPPVVQGDVAEDANMMLGFRARMFYEWNETITWVPYVNYRSFDFSLKLDAAVTDPDWENFGVKGMLMDIGLGANIKVNEDNLLLFAIEPYSYSKYEPSEPGEGDSWDVTTLVMPRFYLGLESDVKDWLTFRAGVKKDLAKEETTWDTTGEGEGSESLTYAPFDFYMGLGFHVGDFDIDMLLNNDVPMHLGYWLTGYQTYEEEAPICMITATYGF